jgi:predicted membrane protein
MQELKDILSIIMIAIIVAVVITLSFMFAMVLIPLAIGGAIYCYVKDEKLHQRLD